VVHRLLSLVQPHTAYFGEKDFQQLVIVKELVRRLSMPVDIRGCPTLREADGLAMSSRNLLLDAERRKAASLIFKGLSTAQAYIPHHRPEAVKALVRRFVEQNPLLSVEYMEIVDPSTLQPITDWEGYSEVRGCIAVQTGGPRLIDNVSYTID
jgi:pantoate--beta-alanine ligase